jgi:hypothetical protein
MDPAIQTCPLPAAEESNEAVAGSARVLVQRLQVSVQKRLSHGLEFQSAYTYSKNLDLPQGRLTIDGEALTPQAPLYVDRGRSVVNATHNWRFNTLYALPSLKTSGLASKLTNGWSVQNIVSAQTGFAFTPAAPGDVSLNALTSLNAGYERPDLVTSANIGGVTTCVVRAGEK